MPYSTIKTLLALKISHKRLELPSNQGHLKGFTQDKLIHKHLIAFCQDQFESFHSVLQCSANLIALKFANVIISKVDSIFLNDTTSNQIFTFFNKKLKECNMYKSDAIFLNVTTSNQICTFFNEKLKNATCTKVVLQTQLKHHPSNWQLKSFPLPFRKLSNILQRVFNLNMFSCTFQWTQSNYKHGYLMLLPHVYQGY